MQETTSFEKIDLETARMQYESWATKQQETLDEFLLRKRKIELNCLVKKVIENELSDTDKLIVRLHWYEGKSLTQTAVVLKMSKSTVSKHLDKINNTIFDKLKYAIEYRYGNDYSHKAKIIIKDRDALCCFITPESSGERIKSLRLSQAMTIKDVSEMTGISAQTLELIESGKKQATAVHIGKIATAFKTDCNFIILGEKERKCC